MKPEKTQKIIEQTKDVYNRIASDFSDTRGKWWRGMGDFDKYVKDGDKVLDFGCGNGRMAEIFASEKIEYLGIDNSEELIKIARERFKDRPWIKFEVGDILDFVSPPFQGGVRGGYESHDNNPGFKTTPWPLLGKEGKFDLVLMIAVLHHIPTKELRLKVLKDINKLSKPGGWLILVNWNLWKIFSPPARGGEVAKRQRGWERIKKKFRYYKYLFNYREKFQRGIYGWSDAFVPWKPAGMETRRYIHSFGKGELKRLLKRAGFGVEEINFEVKGGKKVGIFRGDNLLAVAVKKVVSK